MVDVNQSQLFGATKIDQKLPTNNLSKRRADVLLCQVEFQIEFRIINTGFPLSDHPPPPSASLPTWLSPAKATHQLTTHFALLLIRLSSLYRPDIQTPPWWHVPAAARPASCSPERPERSWRPDCSSGPPLAPLPPDPSVPSARGGPSRGGGRPKIDGRRLPGTGESGCPAGSNTRPNGGSDTAQARG